MKGGEEKMEQDTKEQDMPATLKQIGYLNRLGVTDIPADLTKQQASQMIDEALEQESE